MKRGRPRYPGLLTPREQEVLALLRHGLTNEQVAQRLQISRDGVKYHVSEILSKLGVDSRRDAALWNDQLGRTRRGFALVPLLHEKLFRSILAKALTLSTVVAAVGVLFALLAGVLEMKNRTYGLEAIDVEWYEAAVPTPSTGELTRPWSSDSVLGVPKGVEDVWHLFVVEGERSPSLLWETHRRLEDVVWSQNGKRLMARYWSRVESPTPNMAGPLGAPRWAAGLRAFEITGAKLWDRLFRGLTFTGASKEGELVSFVDNGSLFLIDANGSGTSLKGLGPELDSNNSWSPDGKFMTIGVVQRNGRDRLTIHYLLRPNENEAYLLGPGSRPVWAPDSTKIAMRYEDDLLIFNARDGSQQHVDINAAGQWRNPTWSPDSDWIAIGELVVEAKSGRIAAEAEGPTVHASAISRGAGWQLLALDPVADDRPCPHIRAQRTEIKIREVSTGFERTLLGCEDDLYTEAAWLPNEMLIARGSNCVSCEPSSYRVSLIDPSSGKITPLTQGLESAASYELSPDGEGLLVTGSKLRVYTTAGELLREFSPPPGHVVLVAAWTKDGSSFAYITGPAPWFL